MLLLAMATLWLITSCDPPQKLVSPVTNASNYEWMTAKMNGELSVEDNTFSFTGSLRMRRDSAIWRSISAFMGMESVRALITPDTVLLLNRMNQTYMEEPTALVAEKLHTPTFQDTQAMLLGDGASDHVALRWGPYTAKIHYSERQWNVPATFPIKVNKSYERMKL